mmetsp:Transcript_31192/g.56629  ORF Transcript_31192/g.56629 Transcript_31192/m.56629 type:complete len:343 (-) Transcript_31192:645-1673(-)|eukprot:CAMPEP_0175086076 /NCGR_PEP_ID=MMETSP0052_2-20121109/29036_1 /TAXON_ID=51329 ORGANISM="Polytomella parva, Strain SAG 63-3" /NCGR_SAMPLE_ID=MMETSP0052_2 /ASSEMBLY_ACC=CAM_ASM_000194 /LENGTH=342 /DNA_ID=CAMNT_0016358195 /DNA_START=180 /DNA_END=1208 /DNA_ORIENTATION=-
MRLIPFLLEKLNPCLALAYKTVHVTFQLQTLANPIEVLCRLCLFASNEVGSNTALTLALMGGDMFLKKVRVDKLSGRILQQVFGNSSNLQDLELLQQFSLVENCLNRLRDEAILSAVSLSDDDDVEMRVIIFRPPLSAATDKNEDVCVLNDDDSNVLQNTEQDDEPAMEMKKQGQEAESSLASTTPIVSEVSQKDGKSNSAKSDLPSVTPKSIVPQVSSPTASPPLTDEELAGLLFLREALLRVIRTHVDDVEEDENMEVLQKFRHNCAFDSKKCISDFFYAAGGAPAKKLTTAIKEAGGTAGMLRQLNQRLESSTVSLLVEDTLGVMRTDSIDALVRAIVL